MKKFDVFLKEIAVVNKKTIVFDVDGVLLNFHEGFIKHNANKKLINNEYDFGLGKEKSYELIKEFWGSDDFQKVPIINGAKEAVNELSKYFNIILVTAINEEFKDKRIKNLEGFNYKELHCIPHNKVQWVKDNYTVDCAIEDKMENIIEYSHFTKMYSPHWDYNKNLEQYTTYYNNFNDLVEKLKNELV